jgi:large subunit ribosomal protein L25
MNLENTMSEHTFEATLRSDLGKGASRRLRRDANLVPAIIYGAKKEPNTISLCAFALANAMKNESFYSTILELSVAGKKEKVVVKAIQRHPFKPIIQHMDFLRISAHEKVTMLIPIHITGEEECIGIKQQGGMLSRVTNEVEISCLPGDLPEYITLDISDMELDETRHLSAITLPKGVELVALSHDNDLTVASIHKPRAIKEDSPEASSETDTDADADADKAKVSKDDTTAE